MDLQDATVEQGELDLEADAGADRGNLMTTLDELNERYGRGTLLMASAGLDGKRRVCAMKQERRTPRYTTYWDEMLVARDLRF